LTTSAASEPVLFFISSVPMLSEIWAALRRSVRRAASVDEAASAVTVTSPTKAALEPSSPVVSSTTPTLVSVVAPAADGAAAAGAPWPASVAGSTTAKSAASPATPRRR
jgi:hypothetical protein